MFNIYQLEQQIARNNNLELKELKVEQHKIKAKGMFFFSFILLQQNGKARMKKCKNVREGF